MEQKKYHYFYKIENMLNGKYYYGIHSTDNLSDKYFGSGKRLNEDIKLFGKSNFKKTILQFFATREDASIYEQNMVTEFLVKDNLCYNMKIGGDYGKTIGTILVIDRLNGKWARCTANDENYLNGRYVPFMEGLVSVINLDTNKREIITSEELLLHRNIYKTSTQGKVIVKDNNDKFFTVSQNDVRYLNGEYTFLWKGRKHTEETKQKMSRTSLEKGLQKGEKNSQFGTCWIKKDGFSMKIKKTELDYYLNDGWEKGRIINATNIKCRAQDKLDIIKIKQDLAEGLSKCKIGEKYCVDRGTIRRFIMKNNLES